MAEILTAMVLPTGKLSLEISPGVSDVDRYRVTITPPDPDEEFSLDVPLVQMVGFDMVRNTHYLPAVISLLAADYSVSAQPMFEGALVGSPSAPVVVSGVVKAYWEEKLRQVAADILASAGLEYEGQTVTVLKDRFGRPITAVAQLGLAGIYVVVGVPYMTASDTFVDSDNTAEEITLPITVYAKASHPDGAVPAVAVAAVARRKLNAADLSAWGVTRWMWSGEAPDDTGDRQIAVRMQMQLSVEFTREECA